MKLRTLLWTHATSKCLTFSNSEAYARIERDMETSAPNLVCFWTFSRMKCHTYLTRDVTGTSRLLSRSRIQVSLIVSDLSDQIVQITFIFVAIKVFSKNNLKLSIRVRYYGLTVLLYYFDSICAYFSLLQVILVISKVFQ